MKRIKLFPFFTAIAAVLLLGLLAAACGGDDDDSGATSTPGATPEASTDTLGSGGILRIGMSAGNIPIPNTAPNEGFEVRRFVGYQIYDALTLFNVDQGDTVPV